MTAKEYKERKHILYDDYNRRLSSLDEEYLKSNLSYNVGDIINLRNEKFKIIGLATCHGADEIPYYSMKVENLKNKKTRIITSIQI